MIKIIIKASKVSKRNMNKSLSIVKKFMKLLKIVLTDREIASWSNIFCCLGRFSSVVELFIDFFDKWVVFCEKLLGANFMVFGRSSLLYFYLSGDLGYF